MTLNETPYYWNSAHRPVWFSYDYESKNTVNNTSDGGYARLTIATAYTENSSQVPAVGDLLYIGNTTSIYYGVHTVRTVNSSTDFTLNTAYVAGVLPGHGMKFIRIPEIKIYKGYDTGETYDTELPLTLIGTFTPRNSPDYNIRFDVSGYLRSIFTTIPAISASGYNYEMFNRFRLHFDGAYQDFFYVLNSAIEHSDLNEYYINTGRYLTEESAPYLMDCGKNVLARITDDAVYVTLATSDDFIDVTP